MLSKFPLADESIKESMVEPLHRDVGCLWSCLILLEPWHISTHTTTCSKCPPEFVQHINVTLLFYCDCLLVFVFKPKLSDYSMFWYGHSSHAFHIAQGPLKHLVWSFCAPIYTVNSIDMATARNVLRRWTKHPQWRQGPLQSCSWTTATSLNVFPCQLVWIYAWSGFCIGKAEDPSIIFFAMMYVKDKRLQRDFFGFLPKNLSPYPISEHLPVNFLPDLRCSVFLLRFVTDPVTWNLYTQR